jgi:hypothetical protein
MADLVALCTQAYYATGDWERQDSRTRWVMDLGSYKQIRAACEAIPGHHTDPDEWVPDPGDMMFGIAIDVREDGGEPHLETPALSPYLERLSHG